ncbi:MAG: N-acetylmuramoyl-L-alanine amidase [Armatimonadetes bacterium]|nr:N-acetylmuramoyl-L-alanine amidase [Armatimonadota bacterium]
MSRVWQQGAGRRRRRARRARGVRRLLLVLLALAAWAGWRLAPPLRRPDAIIIHHSATPASVDGRPVDAAAIDAMHARRGFRVVYEDKVYHIGYHYVILPDGEVQPGRPERAVGAHARHENRHSLGVCLIGNFSSDANPRGARGPARPSEAQMRALEGLCRRLMRQYAIAPERVLRHSDVVRTECPGDRFPFAAFREMLRRGAGERR